MTNVLTTSLPPIEVTPAVIAPDVSRPSSAAEIQWFRWCAECEVGWRGRVGDLCWSCDNEGTQKYGPGS